MKSSKKRKRRMILCAAAVLLCLLSFSACSQPDSGKTPVRIHIQEQETADGTVVQIPEFQTDNEEIRKNLRDLDKETKALQKIVEKEQKKGTHLEMRSYLREEKDYPQVTVVWYLSEDDTRLYDLVTLGVDEREGIPITCKEALEKTGMTGVDLSLRVGKLVQDSEIRGEVASTEMQGFRIDEAGDVSEIYMKLLLRTVSVTENEENEVEEEENLEEHFFSYFPKEEKLIRLSEQGFDVP